MMRERIGKTMTTLTNLTALGVVLLAAATSPAGQLGENFPRDNTSGCASGQCKPPIYGYHRPQIRPWPGSTIYEGYRRRRPAAEVPDWKIPTELDEARTSPRTRSTETDTDTNGAAGASPENPFNNIVPENELPTPEAETGFGDENAAINDLIDPNVTLPLNENPFDAAVPEDDNPFNPAVPPNGENPFEPGGMVPQSNPFNPDEGDSDDPFSFQRTPRDSLRASAARSITNRTPRLLTETGPREIIGQPVDIPRYATLGGPFSLADLAPTRAPRQTTSSQIIEPSRSATARQTVQQVGYLQSGQAGSSELVLVKVDDNEETKAFASVEVAASARSQSNPLRNPERRASAAADKETTPPLVEQPRVELHPVPTQGSQPMPKQAEPPATAESNVTAVELQSESNMASRFLQLAEQRSLRDTLRKNPLR